MVFWLLLTGTAAGIVGSGLDEIWVIYFFVIQAIAGFILFFVSMRDRRTRNLLIFTAVIAILSGGITASVTYPFFVYSDPM